MARRSSVLDLPLIGTLDRQGGSLSRQLVQALREAVRVGDLRPGEALPATRLLAEALQAAFCGARLLMDRHPPGADQHVLAAFMNEGHLQRHVRRVRNVYAERRLQLMDMVARLIPADLAWLLPSDQGMHLVLWLATGLDDRAVTSQAQQAGIAVRATSPMFFEARRRPGLLLGLGDFEPAWQEQALCRLAHLIATARAG